MNKIPGSAQSHVDRRMSSHSARALMVSYTRSSNTRSKVPSVLTASMNASVTPTDRLNCVSVVELFLIRMNSAISGWSTRRTPICAPRLCPAELIVLHTASKIPMKLRGPLERLSKPLMSAPDGRSVLKSYPIPPPSCIVLAACCAANMMPSMLSGIVIETKQLYGVTRLGAPIADCTRPAGMKRMSYSMSRN